MRNAPKQTRKGFFQPLKLIEQFIEAHGQVSVCLCTLNLAWPSILVTAPSSLHNTMVQFESSHLGFG